MSKRVVQQYILHSVPCSPLPVAAPTADAASILRAMMSLSPGDRDVVQRFISALVADKAHRANTPRKRA